jgi:phosphatidylglycerophosphatase C
VASAVFDFDGTLIDGDSTTWWLLDLFRRSPLRLLVALSVLPLALPMVLAPSTRRRGASIFLWIATWGMDEVALQRSLARFAQRFAAGELPIAWRGRGIATLEQHLAEGHRVAVATAAPALLVRPLLAAWEARIILVGSTLSPFAGGWVCSRHCYAEEKCLVLSEIGYPSRWQCAYTDSYADRALLERAERGFVINPSRRLLARVRADKLAEQLAW